MAKTKKKHGCLYTFLILSVVFIVVMIGLIIMVQRALNVFGMSVSQFKEYMKILNRSVNESAIATDPVTPADYTRFYEKATASGFGIFDEHGNVDITLTSIPIDSDLTLTGYEVAAMLNNGFSSNSNYELLKVLQFTITARNNSYYVKTVLKINLSPIKKAIGELSGDLPNSIYLICESTASASNETYKTPRLILTDSNLHINQLTEEENKEIVGLLNKMTEGAKGNLNFSNLSDKIISDVISDIAMSANCYITLDAGTLTFNKN